MAEIRERKLIIDGSICEDAHSYQDPGVMTVAAARAKGRQQCPIFRECMYGKVLDRRRVRCAAAFGHEVAKYALTDGHSVEIEMEEFRHDVFDPANPVAEFPFIDPYKNPESVIHDHNEAIAAVEGWANTITYGPRLENQ